MSKPDRPMPDPITVDSIPDPLDNLASRAVFVAVIGGGLALLISWIVKAF